MAKGAVKQAFKRFQKQSQESGKRKWSNWSTAQWKMSSVREYHFILKCDGPVWLKAGVGEVRYLLNNAIQHHTFDCHKKVGGCRHSAAVHWKRFTRRGKGVLPCIMPAESLEAFWCRSGGLGDSVWLEWVPKKIFAKIWHIACGCKNGIWYIHVSLQVYIVGKYAVNM